MEISLPKKPRVLMLTDVPNWSFDITARALKPYLEDEFDITILPVSEQPELDESQFDLAHIYGVQQTYHRKFFRGKAKIVMGVNGLIWEDEGMTADELYDQYLRDAHALIVVNQFLLQSLQQLPIPVYLYHQGVDTKHFTLGPPRSGPLIAGWAGNTTRPIKQFHMTQEACDGTCELKIADGSLSQDEMAQFYHGIDIILSSSRLEGCPRPAIEAMSCGKFPVTFQIGVMPEVVTHGINGLLVETQSVEALRGAVEWCKDHRDHVRSMAYVNRERMCASRDWSIAARRIATIYNQIL